jgi:hypothetical protein
MKLIPFFCVLFVASIGFSQTDLKPFINSIKQQNLEKHVYTLASDSLEGRETGEPGQKKAASYIANHFKENGLDNLGQAGYLQPYNLYKYNFGLGKIKIRNTGYWAKKYPYYNLWGGSVGTQEINFKDTLHIKYLGYGKDVQSSDLRHNVVMMLMDENLGATYSNIKQVAKLTGAKYFLVFMSKRGQRNYDSQEDRLYNLEKADHIGEIIYKMQGPFLDKYYETYTNYADSLEQFFRNEDTLFISFGYPWDVERLVNLKYKKLVKLEKKVLAGKAERKVDLINDTAICSFQTKYYQLDTLQTENVLAFVEGTDKKEEVIVVSAHYDHLGKRGKNIYYGADDNASGTAAVMEMASAFQNAAKEGVRPKRSILFVAFSGEEVGLRGSDYFVDNCPVPIENVVLNLNLDMIGRNQQVDSTLFKTAFFLAKGKHKRKYRRMGKRIGKSNENLILSTHPGFQERLMWAFSSDHFRFKRKNIPFICFFTGLHEDYHKPQDTPDKINYPKLTNITKAGFQLIWDIANLNKKIAVKVKHPKKKSFIERSMD